MQPTLSKRKNKSLIPQNSANLIDSLKLLLEGVYQVLFLV